MARRAEATRIVADADVLAADVFVDGAARAAMDLIRGHGWLELVASEALLDDADAVIERLGDRPLADAWRSLIEGRCRLVEHPAGDHPGLASAYAGAAGHLLSYDGRLATVEAGVAMRQAMPLSVRTPDAFVRVVDVEALYESVFDAAYPGPDADPRA